MTSRCGGSHDVLNPAQAFYLCWDVPLGIFSCAEGTRMHVGLRRGSAITKQLCQILTVRPLTVLV
jgi:hypothetical protein